MRSFLIAMVFGAGLICGAPGALGQQATERYIPIGQSPGLSHRQTAIGLIEAIDVLGHTIRVAGPAGARTATVTARTEIWLDRTRLGRPGEPAGFDACVVGRTVEIKYEAAGGDRAEWIKIDAPD